MILALKRADVAVNPATAIFQHCTLLWSAITKIHLFHQNTATAPRKACIITGCIRDGDG